MISSYYTGGAVNTPEKVHLKYFDYNLLRGGASMAGMKHLTGGPIGRQLIALSAPLLMGNILQQLYNTVDAVIVGRFVGDSAFGAVGVAGSVMNLFLFLISGGCDGVSTLLSQFYGAEDGKTFRRDFYLSGVFGAGASLVLTALGLAVLPVLLTVLQTPEQVAVYAAGYLRIIFLGFPAAFAYHLSSGVLRAVGNTRAALFFLALSMGVNLALDLAFVAGLAMGVAGAAVAVFTGQNTGAGNNSRVRDGFRQGQKLLFAFGLCMSLVMILGAEPFLRLVLPKGNESGLGPAMAYLRLVACFYLFNFLGSGQAGYFRGRGRVNIPVIGATGHISLRVVLSFLLAPVMGLPAVALATGLGWVGVVTFWSILAGREINRLT